MVTRFGWFSDCHLGLAQYGLQSRYDDMFKAVNFVIQDMHAKGIRRAICTGDLLNSVRPSPDTIARLRQLGRSMVRCGMECLVPMGNHDLTPRPNWVDLVCEEADMPFGWNRIPVAPNTVSLRTTSPLVGMDFCGNDQLRKTDWGKLSAFQVLGLHVAVREFVRFKSDSVISCDELPIQGQFAAVLLGDIHVCDLRQTADGVLYGYPGSTEMCRENEPENKFWIEVVLENGKVVEFNKHRIKTRPVVRLPVEAEDKMQEVLKTLRELAHEQAGTMVFARYDPNIADVVTRMRQVPGVDKLILRTLPLEIEETPEDVDPELVVRVDPLALLRKAVPEGPLQVLAERLLEPTCEVRPILRDFVNDRLPSP